MSTSYVRTTHQNAEEHRRELATRLNEAINGGLNVTGQVTFAVSTTSTVLNDPRINAATVILLSARNAKAQTTTWYVSAKGAGTLTLTHPNITSTDAEFDFALFY